MSIVQFPPRATASAWRPDELVRLLQMSRGQAGAADGDWAIGATERGEPQFYLLGPAPRHDCVLCVSRLATGYVIEDGAGRLIGEAPSLDRFAAEAARAALRRGQRLIGRLALLWCTIRLAVEEKLEPAFDYGEELLARFAPQVLALV